MDTSRLLTAVLEAEERYEEARTLFAPQARALFQHIRAEHGWSQRGLARMLGCHYSYISKIEHGHSVPGRALLLRLQSLVNKEEHYAAYQASAA